MTNPTVRELMEILKTMNQDAIVCGFEVENDTPIYYTFETCCELKNAKYINDFGDDVVGDIVSIG